MAFKRAQAQLGHLWQFPLLLVSIGLFGYAAFVFVDPKPGLTASQRIEIAEAHLKYLRFEAAVEQCNKILASDKLKSEDESHIHLLLARILEAAQDDRHISLAANHERIIAQSKMALDKGTKGTSDIYRRMGGSYEALGKTVEALDAYRRAIAQDSNRSLPLQRKVIELQLMLPDTAPAEASIEEYLRDSKLVDAERAWAIGEKSQALIKKGQYSDAKRILDQALRFDLEPLAQGVAHYWLGDCLWNLHELGEAERVLRVARDQLQVKHPLDAEAAYLLGKIRQEQNDPKEALSFYDSVLTTHPESRPAPLAELGRGLCRLALNDDEAALSGLHDLVVKLGTKKSFDAYKPETIAGLKQASTTLAAKGNLLGALEVMEQEQTLAPDPAPEFFARLGDLYERRADEVEAAMVSAATPVAPSLKAVDQKKAGEDVRTLRAEAGDAYVAVSRGLTLEDDRGKADAMWKGVDLYDRAGAMPQAISALEQFVAERPDDGQTPDALLRLGRTYQATGQFDKAIKTFQQNQFRYPQTLAASKSGVPLAQSYIAKGPQAYPKAEKVLLAVLENNPIITPEAEEFRQALFELSQLYYRTGRYEDAVARLEETTQRYPNDPHMAQLFFLMGDSYRKSASLLTAKVTTSGTTPQAIGGAAMPSTNPVEVAAAVAVQAEAAAARRDRLAKAKVLFDRVIDTLHQQPSAGELDKLYLKLSNFYRADCLYDLGEYEAAIKLYDAATLRYQDDPSSVAAYVQIVNAYCALGRLDDARTANERAKWLLRKMPAEAFNDGKFGMPKKYWDDWLRYTSESGMYSKEARRDPLSAAR